VRQALTSISTGVPGARWTQPDNLHLTLRFIGEVPEPDFRDIAEVLSLVDGRPFTLRLKGVGQFGDRRRAHVLWAGVEAGPELQRLRNRVENRLKLAGLPPEGRKFTPHVTLARLKSTPLDWVGRYIAEHGRFATPPFEASAFALFSSHLGQAGAIHTLEADYPLTAAAA
jgi:2'-5' RNA ligase